MDDATEIIEIRGSQSSMQHVDKAIPSDNLPWTTQSKQEYDHTTEGILSRERGNVYDPLAMLPVELWIKIFQEYAAQAEATSSAPSTFDLTLLLTSVSRRWCDSILNTATLWTSIPLGHGLPGDTLAKCYAALSLSANLPINVFIHVGLRDWEATLPIIHAHTDRIRAIHIFGGRYPERRNLHNRNYYMTNAIISLGGLPTVQSITAAVYTTIGTMDWVKILPNMPSLNRIDGLKFPSRDLALLNPSMTCLEMDVFPRGSFAALSRFHSLETFKMSSSASTNSTFDYSTLPDLPRLRHLNPLSISSRFRLADIIPKIKGIIHLRVVTDDIAAFLSVVDQLLYLVDLEILLNPRLFVPPEHLPVVSRVHSLLLGFNSFSNPKPSAEVVMPKLLGAIGTCFPMTRRLTINVGVMEQPLVEFINSLARLERCTFQKAGNPSPMYTRGPLIPPISAQFLLTLAIMPDRLPSPKFLFELECPRLRKLTLGYRGKFTLKPHIFENLQELELVIGQEIWEITDLRALRVVHITTSDAALSDLLEHVIIWPEQLPALEEIGMQIIPEWDLLFLMLERRNALRKPDGPSPIKKLILPSTPHRILLDPLLMLIRGVLTIRPPTEGYALSEQCKIIYDPTITGCHRCLRLMRSCSEPLVYRQQVMAPSFKRRSFSGVQLPSSIRSWLEGRHDRYAYCLEQHTAFRELSKLHARAAFCSSAAAEGPCIITR